jgi:dynein intermediate chain, cytosolic
LVNSLVGVGGSSGTSRAESVISSSNVSDSEKESGTIPVTGVSFAEGKFSMILLPPIVDIPPPVIAVTEKEVVSYSKEVQTISTWVPEQENEEDAEEILRRRVEEELQKEIERLRLEEEREKEVERQVDKEEKSIPGTSICGLFSYADISEEEQLRILSSETFYDFVSRSTKIAERALDEDYDVLTDYTMAVEANQYVNSLNS